MGEAIKPRPIRFRLNCGVEALHGFWIEQAATDALSGVEHHVRLISEWVAQQANANPINDQVRALEVAKQN